MIIGLTGHMQTGKDTVGGILVERHGFTRYAFADQLKSMALVLNPIVQQYKFPKHPERLRTLVELKGWEYAKTEPEVRRFLQVLGTEGVRDHIGEESWIAALARKAKVYAPGADGRRIAITDVRFPNEAQWIHRMGGTVWRILRPGYDGDGHASEREIERIHADLTVHNYGTIGNLKDWVDAMMKHRVGN